MSIKVLKNHLIEDALRLIEQVAQVTSKCNEICFQLSHRILSQTSRAEADALAEWTDPPFALTAIQEVHLILGFETK